MTVQPDQPETTRRQVLCGLMIALLAPGTLAACGGGTGGSGSGGSSTGGPNPGGSGSGGPTGTGTGTGGGSAGGSALARVSDIPVGGGKIVDTPDGGKVLIVQPVSGTIKAYDPTCTHQRFFVDAPVDNTITCVQGHGSRFKAEDGSVTKGPARSPLAQIDVRVEGGSVVMA